MAYQPKSYKKFVATAATATLVATAIVPVASAADAKAFTDVSKNYTEAVNYLVANGITQGMTETKFGTDAKIKRGDAAIFIANALKLDVANAKDADFTDVNARVKGAVNAIVEAKIASGKTESKFAPDDLITRQEMAKMLSNAYKLTAKEDADFKDVSTTWIKYVSALKENGITLGKTETTFAPTDSLTRGEFALFMFRAEGGGTPPVVAPTTATKVESVSATNLKEVHVTFNGTVDKATAGETTNYSITQGSSSVTVYKAVVSEDGKSVVLTVNGVLGSQKEHKLAVSNIKAGDKVLSEKDIVFTPVDTTLPTVSKVEALGNKTVRVSFSEPIQDALTSNFTIDDKVVVGSVKTAGNTVILKLSSVLTDGEHTISTSGVKDFANFVTVKSDSKFNVVEDKVAPTVVKVVSASFEKVVLQFSEPIEQVLASNVYWMQGASKKYPDANGVKQLSDDTFEFTFSNTNKLVYATDLFIEGVKDYSGNEIAKETKIQVNPIIDQTRPEVLSAELDKNTLKTIKVKFSKVLNTASATKTANYVIKDKDGKVQTVTNNITLTDGGRTAVLTLVNKLADNSEYTLTINGVSDNTTLQNVILPYTTTLTVKDVTAPTLASVKRLDNFTLVIDYNEAMATSGDGNVLDASKYSFAVGTDKYVPVNYRVTGDAKSVIVTFDRSIAGLTVNGTVRLVKDVAGNYIAPLEKDFTVLPTDVVTTGIKDAVATGTKTVVLEFDRSLQSLDANDFIIKTGATVNRIVTATLSANGKKATLTLDSHLTEDVLGVTYETITTPNSQDSLGGKLTAKGSTTVKDEISATLETDANGVAKVAAVGITATEFELTFNEAVTAVAGAQAFFEVKDSQGNKLAVTSATATNSKVLKITLTNPVANGTVTIAAKENPLVKDASQNSIAAFDAIQVDNVAVNHLAVLTGAITAAQTAHDGVLAEGAVAGDTIVGSKATLNSAIIAATAVKNNVASTPTQLSAATTTLNAAVVTFNASKVATLTGLNAVSIAGTASDSTNVVTLATGETLALTSSDITNAVATVTEDPAGTAKVTGVAVGGPITITVEVKNAAGNVVKTGTFTVTVTL